MPDTIAFYYTSFVIQSAWLRFENFIDDFEHILPKRITDNETAAAGEVAKDVFAAVSFLFQAQNNRTYLEIAIPLVKFVNGSSFSSLLISRNITDLSAEEILLTKLVIKSPQVRKLSI